MGVGGSRKTNIEGGLPKKVGGGAWTVCKFKRGQGLDKKEGVVFVRGVGGGWYPNAHYELRLKLTSHQSTLLVAEY